MNWKINLSPFSFPFSFSFFILLWLIIPALLSACDLGQTKPLTLEQAKTYKFRITVNGVPFDIPVNYAYSDYAYNKRWPVPTKKELEGKGRRKVDTIKVLVVLPEFEPYSENNSKAFEGPGWDKQVLIYLTNQRNVWEYYFKHAVPNLKNLPPDPKVPGMHRYHDAATNRTIYLSHDRPSANLVRIICIDPRDVPSPSCNVDTSYLGLFDLKITFSLRHLESWRSIEQRTKLVMDSFRSHV